MAIIKDTLKEDYNRLLTIKQESNVNEIKSLLLPFNTNHLKRMEFTDIITDDNNDKILLNLVKLLDVYKQNYDIQIIILTSLKILSRTRKGLNNIYKTELHILLNNLLNINNIELQKVSLGLLVNTAVLNLKEIQNMANINKTFNSVINLLLKTNNDDIIYLCLHYLFFITVEKKVSQQIYDNNKFFKYIFDLFLIKTQYYNKPLFWQRKPINNDNNSNNNNDNINSDAKTDDSKENINDDTIQASFNTEKECNIILELLKVLFNFTMVEESVLRFKLDKFDAKFQRKVVSRACGILTLPLKIDPLFDLNNITSNDTASLLDKPGLIRVKLGICNVALYNGDILGMNLPEQSGIPLGNLLKFLAYNTNKDYNTQQNICPLLMFLKHVVGYNVKVRAVMKKYIFHDNADIPDDDLDDDDLINPAQNNDNNNPNKKLKDMLLKYCCHINYSIKRTIGEFFFALSGDDTKEMVRVCGLGNAIGVLVDKGLPGFAGIADKNSIDIEELARLKRKKDQRDKQKKLKQKQNDTTNNDNTSDNNNNNDSNNDGNNGNNANSATNTD